MQEKVALDNLKIVPEEIIVFCASQFGPEEKNGFADSIDAASEFRKAGLTPIYLCSDSFKQVIVTTKEKLTKQYN